MCVCVYACVCIYIILYKTTFDAEMSKITTNAKILADKPVARWFKHSNGAGFNKNTYVWVNMKK